MRQKELLETEALKEALKNFIEATEELNRSYNALKAEVKRLNEELSQQKNLLKAVIESIRDGVVAVDQKNRVMLANQTAKDLFGIEEGKNLESFIHNLQEEMEFYTIEGKRKVLKVRRFPLLQEGKNIGEVIVLRDITRERELEEENKRKERLSAMGKMAVTIAHEIRNPLGSIELFAGLLRRGGTPEEQKRWAEGIIRVVKSINTLITNMLTFTRPLHPEPKPCDLREIAEECLHMASAAIREKEVEAKIEGEECTAWVDPELIKQALLNLIINALQAMEEGGKLTIRIEKGNGECSISVSDTGCGIPVEVQKRIFDPFFTTKKKGTGLGLAIVHRIVEAHSGRIHLKSRPGETTFTITLPAKCSEA